MSTEWAWVWIPATIVAAAFQVGRNAIQRSLTEQLGTIGATQVRFLYGFPFAVLFAAMALWATSSHIPTISWSFVGFTIAGAVSQIAATALMLAAMRKRAFVVVTVWTKTEPVQVALFGLLVLSDQLTWKALVAIGVATAGVILMARQPKKTDEDSPRGWQPVAMGLLAGGAFAVAAVSFRGAFLALGDGHFLAHASWSLACGLGVQSLLLAGWMSLFDPNGWRRCLAAWRVSIWGGLLGASASQGWFLGFALTAAANVRTLGLVEVLFAQLFTWRVFLTKSSRHETIGMLLMVIGVVLLLQ